MSEFKVEVCRITVEKHPDPEVERLEVGLIGDFKVVVGKGNHKTGDLVAYIPEAAIVPDPIAEAIGVLGKLSGTHKNRVKPVRLRGVISEGLVCPAKPEWVEGQDVTNELGVTKYEPPIPTEMRGKFGGRQAGNGFQFNFDVENIKKYKGAFGEGEEVVMTEKVHGTCCIFMWHREAPNGATDMFKIRDAAGNIRDHSGVYQIGTKNLSKIGVYFGDHPDNHGNVYVKTFLANGNFIEATFSEIFDLAYKKTGEASDIEHVFLLGEVFGPGVQDLGYGGKPGELQYRVFGAAYIDPATKDKVWLSSDELDAVLDRASAWDRIGTPLKRVPVLYRGPFSAEVLAQYTSGKDFSGSHIREGVIVQPVVERQVRGIGRLLLKSVSPEYLFRKGNTTEFT